MKLDPSLDTQDDILREIVLRLKDEIYVKSGKITLMIPYRLICNRSIS